MGLAPGCSAAAQNIKSKGLDLVQAKQLINSKRQGLSSWQKHQLIGLVCNSKMGQKAPCKQCNMKDGLVHRALGVPCQ